MQFGPWSAQASRSSGRANIESMSNGQRILTIPRHNPVNACTMAGIVGDAGLTIDQFRDLL